jgi:serine/alanine racemase
MNNNTKKTIPQLESKRAWVEVDLKALSHNVQVLTNSLPAGCELMAVVKTNAYGIGAKVIAAHLWDQGVKSFAVSSVFEGIQLRNIGFEGEILILGHTHPNDVKYLSEYDLKQLVLDEVFAAALNGTGHRIGVHIGIDTGMSRLGINHANIAQIEHIYSFENLTVEGISSHLSVSDSFIPDDIEFTKTQISNFACTIEALKNKNYDVGKCNILSSFGVINYPDAAFDLVRVGIAMYGLVDSDERDKIKNALPVKPVVSLRANVVSVRYIEAGDSVSYGRIFKAEKPTKVATISIGYADGIPRCISGKSAFCIIRGQRVPIIGRICMDWLMVDVTDIEHVAQGDTATLIGKDGDEEIHCEDFAETCGTITNEILCGISKRLPRIYIS